MTDPLRQTEEQIEAYRTLVKLLQYVEHECTQSGYDMTAWMVAMSRSTLEDELTRPSGPRFDGFGHPRLH